MSLMWIGNLNDILFMDTVVMFLFLVKPLAHCKATLSYNTKHQCRQKQQSFNDRRSQSILYHECEHVTTENGVVAVQILGQEGRLDLQHRVPHRNELRVIGSKTLDHVR